MNKRNCPVCGSNESRIIMRFTPESLADINPDYRLDKFEKAMKGKGHLLAYSKCKKCKMIYCDNTWDDVTLREVYENTIDHAKSKERILSIQKRLWLTRIWRNILRTLKLSGKEKFEDLKIIDYGCGWGDFPDVVQGFGVNAMGYDADSKKIELLRQRGQKIANDVDKLRSFHPVDVFVMISVLEHLQDVEYILNLAKELLKRDGLLVFFVMDYRSRYIKRNVNRLKNYLPALTRALNPVEHVNVYDYKSTLATLKEYDFDFISTDNVLYLTDFFMMRNSIMLIKFFNWIEQLSTKFITWKENRRVYTSPRISQFA